MYQGANYGPNLTVGEIINWGGGGIFICKMDFEQLKFNKFNVELV